MELNLMIIPAITGLVAVFKKIGLPSKYAPIIAIVLGIGLALLQELSVTGLMLGISYGLTSMGLWEVGKLPSKM